MLKIKNLSNLFFVSLFLLSVFVIGSSRVVYAVTCNANGEPQPCDPAPIDCGGGALCNPLSANSIPELLNNVIDAAAIFAGPIAVAMIVYAAYLFVFAVDNKDQVSKAKKVILYTVVGIAVLVFSKTIVFVTNSILGGTWR